MRTVMGPLQAVVVGSLLVLASGCNGSDLATIGGFDDESSPRGDEPRINPDDPHNGGEDAPTPETVPAEWDYDGDGIPNEEDHIPCLAFYAKVWNQEVSSGEVLLNQQVIVDSNTFPTDEVIQEFINPVPGINEITLGGKVAGSPEDVLHIEIWDVAEPAMLYLHETIVRGNGQPEQVSVMFEVDVSC